MVETRTGGEVEEDVGEDDQEVVAVTGVEEVVAETVDVPSGWTSTDLRLVLRTGLLWRTCLLECPGRTSRTS